MSCWENKNLNAQNISHSMQKMLNVTKTLKTWRIHDRKKEKAFQIIIFDCKKATCQYLVRIRTGNIYKKIYQKIWQRISIQYVNWIIKYDNDEFISTRARWELEISRISRKIETSRWKFRISKRFKIKIIFIWNDFSAIIWVQDDEDEAENDENKSSEAQTSRKIDWERSFNSISFK